MKRHLLVFDDGNGDEIDLRAFVDSLDPEAKMFALDGHVCFIESAWSVAQISEQFLKFANSNLFFLTDVTESEYTGRMPGKFWDDFKRRRLSTAAE